MSSLSSRMLLLCGPLLVLLTLLLPPPTAQMSQAAWMITGLMAWMVLWWITEIVPIPVTSLLPMIFIPLLGIDKLDAATSPYAHPLIFLFLGGFFLSIAMEKTVLHKRIALKALSMVGSSPGLQIAAVMAVTAFLSMWMSNTATAVMMLPIGLSIIAMAKASTQDQFGKAVLLGIAYSASIGGVATLIGTPPNALLAAYLSKSYNIQISFADWMLLGVPLALTMLVICWVWLTKIHFRMPKTQLAQNDTSAQLQALGAMSRSQKLVLIVFALAAFSWISQQWLVKWTGLPVSDTVIALCAAALLFILPGEKGSGTALLEWKDSQNLPWGVLLLFGGGLSMADQIQKTGVAELLAQQLQLLHTVPPVLLLLVVTSLIIFLTEVTSNTATAAAFLPLLGPVALSMDLSPLYLVVPAALAASFAFMMPVATPPNAIVFASGKLQIKDMVRAGLVLNLVGIVIISLFSLWLGPQLVR
ncbi:MAG: DASS family sodium-coupled anion symporter [Gammaproteobacteria bacterium]|nr:DASS family sodium-coupled anion symporter [Gammaproteobacteria bacterium]MBU2058762.1 DASS family sodium-coupled anion symporter [Gammaproteobacteria bacterium]MBU2177019.1 DASS family sodium-coupled anion symporter [Gammaproteobacteria bacterium]MBU2246466.1 DASS family sodium-coupled anion symporter [Gammaproteobacteria bacterium]MBU2343663.1 DASS family sodium-coupled anion symporter [Gammaproteobacteria bacterium]